MPNTAPLDWLMARLAKLVSAATDALETEFPGGVDAWQEEVTRQLARYHTAAMMAGSGFDALTPPMETAVKADLKTQLTYLERFGIEVKSAEQFVPGWKSRAAMYAQSIKIPYWQGATKMLPLPAMPAEGTQCLTHCRCQWEISTLEGEGNYDAYWRRSADDSCQTCIQRELTWAPVKIREGVLQI